MSAPVFVLDGDRLRAGDRVVLDGPEGRHAATVRRLAVGEQVVLTDGAGLRADCRVVAAAADRLELVVESRTRSSPQPPRTVVVQALPKGDRGELAVAMLTEVGADVVVPWQAARCVTRWTGPRADRSLARWRSAAREAGKQSRRTHFPEVADLASTADVAGLLRSAALPVVLHEAAGTALAALTTVPLAGDLVVVVGPEGGLAPEELAAFADAGAVSYRLGPSVLRTSTAGVVAVALLLARTPRWG